MEGYKILKSTPYAKRDAIVAAEAPCCPECGENHITINKRYIKKLPVEEAVAQFVYECGHCGTVWQGNLFNRNYDLIRPDERKMRKRLEFALRLSMAFLIIVWFYVRFI